MVEWDYDYCGPEEAVKRMEAMLSVVETFSGGVTFTHRDVGWLSVLVDAAKNGLEKSE